MSEMSRYFAYDEAPRGPSSGDKGEHESHRHVVQFYENDSLFLEELSRFIGSALGAGDATIIIATKAHRNGLARELARMNLTLNTYTQWYWKTDFFTDMSDKAINLHLKYGAQLPTMHSTMHIYPINGAVHRVSTSETAFSFREANFAEVIVGVDPNPANNERMIGWARDYWMALHPYSAGGGYINMMMDEGADNVQAAYRDNYARLAQIKATYDPGNLFHVNQNIKPGM